MVERQEVRSMEEIAGDWYDRVYLPTVEAIHRQGLNELWPKATDADLFLWVGQRRRELFPERDHLGIEDGVRAARADAAPRGRRPSRAR
jgi:hypothetical protein